jgi:NAD(P)-dependent dehydrogenase (short-subunit alcohol dehydrogenase family)
MSQHPALVPGRVAVITGAASGIGLSAARRFATLGMKVVLCDRNMDMLERAAANLAPLAAGGEADIRAVQADVSRLEDIQRLKDETYRAFGEVAVLMNNAGTAPGGGPWDHIDRWRTVLEVNLWGVIHGVQTFTQAMINEGRPGAIINTGSKQGITCPPGDTAYNVSKAGVKVLTEALAHSLRNVPGCRISAHLLVPGSTFTGMTARGATDMQPGMWTPDQVIDFMLRAMANGDFYIVCPDNEVTREIDNLRMTWAVEDITQNRPPLSRWHPDYKDAFAAYIEAGLKGHV